jgi:hypothetical protein
MKKLVLGVLVAVVAVITLGSAAVVLAQTTTPPTPVPDSGYGYMMGGRGQRGGMFNQNFIPGTQDGILHDEMIAVYAEELGLTVDDLNARLANGETMSQIALGEGLTFNEFRTLMTDARNQAIDQAVADDTLTQEQADFMKQRGAGIVAGRRGMHGAGFGGNTGFGCPYFTQTNP